jgi:hypothetical protein
MFRDAGDEDYLVARWAARSGLYFQFYWSAQQTMEKYLKGILLLNGENIGHLGHDLCQLYQATKKIVGALIPDLLCPPRYFPKSAAFMSRSFELTENFIFRFNEYGNPGNRYRHYGMTFQGLDLHRFDEVSFQLRRLVFPLDMQYSGTPVTYRYMLANEPNLQPHTSFPFLRRKKGEPLEQCEYTFAWRNFSYFEEKAKEDGKINSGYSASNSELLLSIDMGTEGREAIDWLVSNARFTKSDRDQLEELVRKAAIDRE